MASLKTASCIDCHLVPDWKGQAKGWCTACWCHHTETITDMSESWLWLSLSSRAATPHICTALTKGHQSPRRLAPFQHTRITTAGEWGKMSEPDNQRKIRTERLESDTQSKFSHTLCKRLKRILCGVFYTLSLFFLSFLNSFCFDKTLFFFYFYMFMSLFLSMIFLRYWWINPKRFPFACGFTVSLGIITAVCVLSRLTLIVFGWCKRFQTHRRMNVD